MERIIIIEKKPTNYQINELGEIINLVTNKKLKGNITRSGYHYYRFSINGQKYRYYTHRLVAKYFLNYDENSKLVINHKDGNKLNNNYTNLEICSQSENVKHAHDSNLITKRTKINTPLNLPNEIWKDIKDFPGYKVSNLGRIKSFKRGEQILKPSIVNSYKQISLSKKGVVTNFLIHRLVYQTFNENEDITNYTIDHIDNNPTNNKLDNLQKITNSENIIKELKKGKTIKKVLAYKNNIFIGEYYSCKEAGRQLGCDASAISKTCRGIYSHTHGFTFKYKD